VLFLVSGCHYSVKHAAFRKLEIAVFESGL